VGLIRVEDLRDITEPRPPYTIPKPDSALVLRVDLGTRRLDTVASVKSPYEKQHVNVDQQGYVQSIETSRHPLPIVDVWTVTPDGSLAVVRGRDYHVDWLDASGVWKSFPKMPFEWQRIDDERKLLLIDSSVKAQQVSIDAGNAVRVKQLAAAGQGGTIVTGSGGLRRLAEIPLVAGRIDAGEMPDYAPAFSPGDLYSDVDNRLWIRTTTVMNGQPVYDIVDRRGVLVDRVQLPPFRTIAGFGPGVIYMAVKDGAGLVHLERARIK
jgi:hypothetical protein